jgi:hypothetical protein
MATAAEKAAAEQQEAREAELLAQAAKDYPDTWRAEKEGDSIVGAFVGLDRASTAFGPCIVATIATKDGPRTVWLLQETLRSQFSKARPAEGELVAILYMGKRAAKNPTPGKAAEYHDYRVTVDRADTAAGGISWDELGGDTPAEPADDTPPAAASQGDLPAGF